MKELFLTPIYLCIILLIWASYTFVAFKYVTKKNIAGHLEKIFIIILLLSMTGFPFFPFTHLNPKALAGVDKTIISAIMQLGIYGSIVFILNSQFRHFFHNTAFLFKNQFLGFLLFISVVSAIWSETPAVTLRYSIVLIGTSAFAAHIAKLLCWQELFSLLRWIGALIALLSIPAALLVPSIGIHAEDQRWAGVIGHPIALGNLMALSTVLWYSYATSNPKNRWTAFGIAIISLIVLLGASSVGAFMTFVVSISLLVLLRFIKRLSCNQAFLNIIFFTILGILTTIFIAENIESILNAFGKDSTLTGRTDFWPKIIEAIKQRPLLGYGCQGFWQPWRGTNNPAAFITTDLDWQAPHAHNGFLDLTLDLGLVGLLLFVFSFLQNVVQAVLYMNSTKLYESTLPLILLVFLVMSNLSESAIWGISFHFFIYILVTVRLSIDPLGKGYSGNQRSVSTNIAKASLTAKKHR